MSSGGPRPNSGPKRKSCGCSNGDCKICKRRIRGRRFYENQKRRNLISDEELDRKAREWLLRI